jgi:hypothetical protein
MIGSWLGEHPKPRLAIDSNNMDGQKRFIGDPLLGGYLLFDEGVESR